MKKEIEIIDKIIELTTKLTKKKFNSKEYISIRDKIIALQWVIQ